MTYSSAIITPSRIVFFMWLVFFIEQYYSIDLGVFGILPRSLIGLIGIISAPLLHGSLPHLISNTFPLLFLGTTLFFFYDKIAKGVFYQCWFVTGFMVWIMGRSSTHIGASGLIYGLAAFLIFFGLFRGDLKSLFISIIVFLLYNTMFYGIFPNHPGVSWESHLFGALVGLSNAFFYRNVQKVSTN